MSLSLVLFRRCIHDKYCGYFDIEHPKLSNRQRRGNILEHGNGLQHPILHAKAVKQLTAKQDFAADNQDGSDLGSCKQDVDSPTDQLPASAWSHTDHGPQTFFSLCHERSAGHANVVHNFACNKHPSKWKANLTEDDALLCALDRIFDNTNLFSINGEGCGGIRLETIALLTRRVKVSEPEQPPAT